MSSSRCCHLPPIGATFLLCFLCCLGTLLPGVGRAIPLAPPEVPLDSPLDVCSAILFDLDHDQVLFEQNADQRIPPASLTKVMSMFLAMDQVRTGLLSPQTTTPVSHNAATTGGSRMGLRARERVTLEQLLTGMAVSSGNDASVAVAELVGGSVPAFVNMMNAKARILGMRGTLFLNPHGLPADGQCTTARDMLTLARAYLRAHPNALRYHNTHVLQHRGRLTWNKNPLLGQYPGADGLKTGWVRASGYNLIFTAGRANRRLLAVILGAPDSETRSIEAFRLLDAGFQVCGGAAPTVAAALHQLPRENYHPDIHLTAREARTMYAGYAAPTGRHKVGRAHKGKHQRQKAQLKRNRESKKKATARVQKRTPSAKQAARRAQRKAG
ncbi:MAG: D-alanyl-D-alanine carboxypeptidase [Desulfovibrio sp.]|nr:D-alanyl-D-alanine carboxypeptidase [Desulfovibrio sp.]